ncbi:uncharacterized protein BX663DRAFT_515290 [Cokeromyces recurvatus]|uniref:uncharacterized protein n=1 Tax=Cokeromyces recurvatus TaxID=90255 RepID=UPI002220605A|nr:uncharacterized protein BX663DRAFT_515290 [Cokeromyces recurvatus]KAI7901214.1 hypothetical protein BX663DRAFT_515290 [Cokeromyces recurvatus]
MNNTNSLSERIKRLQDYLSSQYVDFDQEKTTDRLLSLYSDFSKLKILNPYGYDANVNYWRAVILDCNLHGYLSAHESACLLDQQELGELFYRPKKGKSLSLDIVIEEMVNRTKDLLTLKEYKKRYPIEYAINNSSSSSSHWFQWFTSYFIPSFKKNRVLPNLSIYVVLPTIQEYAKMIIHKHYQKPLCDSLDNLFTFKEFKEEYGLLTCHQETIIQLSHIDLWLLLGYLNHRYGIAIMNHESITIIKFPERNEGLENNKNKTKITANDKAIIKLKMTCAILHEQVNELQMKSEEFIQLTREHYQENHKLQAMYMLKKKKKIDYLLEQRLKTLETMETMLLKIGSAQNDIQVVEAFNTGANLLKSILSLKGNVDKTFESLQDTLNEHKQIEEALQMGNEEIFSNTTNQEELEEELNSIIKEKPSSSSIIITQPIDTQSELLRLQTLLSSFNPSTTTLLFPKRQEEDQEKEAVLL